MSLKSVWFADSPVFYSMAKTLSDIQSTVDTFFKMHSELLPKRKDANILIKPNLHKDLNALMGNTIDLRLLACVILTLKGRGYSNITIAEGPNAGMFRWEIDVFKRLKVDRLAKHFGVDYLDLNYADKEEIELSEGRRASIARIVLENDFFIDIPKLKTHILAQLSICVKSLVGVLSGMQKREMHYDLMENLLIINNLVKPDLYIVDGLVAGEGQGPGICTPKRLDLLVLGTNPYLVDLLCSRLVGFEYSELGYLALAYDRGIICKNDLEACKVIAPIASLTRARKPLTAKIVDLKSFIWLRNLTRPFFDIPLMSKLLFFLQIREDEILSGEDNISELCISKEKCDKCGRCANFCPLGIIPYEDISRDCIRCLYCYMVCPKEAIEIKGELGFMESLINNYSPHTKRF